MISRQEKKLNEFLGLVENCLGLMEAYDVKYSPMIPYATYADGRECYVYGYKIKGFIPWSDFFDKSVAFELLAVEGSDKVYIKDYASPIPREISRETLISYFYNKETKGMVI